MKRLHLWLIAAAGLVIVLALVLALQMGEKSPIFAAGKIRVDESVAAHAKGIQTLYLVIYDAESPMPMPYGAVRESVPANDPKEIDFLITQEKLQVMNPGRPMPKVLRVKARLDLDGVAGMDQAGDLVGEAENVAFGTTDAKITINKRIGSH